MNRNLKRLLVSAWLSAVWLAAASSANAQWTVTNLHPAGATESRTLGVSGGQQVGYAQIGGVQRAGLWNGTAASWTDLHPAGATESRALGGSNGQQVGYAVIGGVPRACMWSGTAVSHVDLHPSGAAISFATAARAGQQGGYARYGTENQAGIWDGSAASWVVWHPPGEDQSAIWGMDTAQVVGQVTPTGSPDGRAALWTGAGSWTDLTPSGAGQSIARAVHSGQQVGAAYFAGQSRACLWTGSPQSWVELHPASAGSGYSGAKGVFDGMQCGHAEIGGLARAGVWSGTANSWVDLSTFLTGSWGYTYAESIWSDGTTIHVVGYGFNNATQRTEALLWTCPVETAITVPLKGYTVNRGARLSGNILSMMFSDPYYLKVASAPGTSYHVAETTVRAKTTVTNPSRLDIRTEARATESNVQTRIALRNLNTNTWDTLLTYWQPTTDTVKVMGNIPNPADYIRQSDGLIRIRIQMIRALTRGPFNKWMDHVEVTVRE